MAQRRRFSAEYKREAVASRVEVRADHGSGKDWRCRSSYLFTKPETGLLG